MNKTEMENWWDDNGGESWRKEMTSRKTQDHYKNQLVLISRVFNKVSALLRKEPSVSVLEMGCGYGRIISYLRDNFKKLDVHGCDQSKKMIEEAMRLGFDKNRLFLDNVRDMSSIPMYDVVYTSEMLIHIRPEDILGVLHNILCKAKRFVVHIENEPIEKLFQKSSNEHCGCWRHNFVALYKKLNKSVEVVYQKGTKHSGYLIKVL